MAEKADNPVNSKPSPPKTVEKKVVQERTERITRGDFTKGTITPDKKG